DMERVPAKTLAADRGQRLLQHGCVEGIAFGVVGRSLPYETVDSPRGFCTGCRRKGWAADDSGCPHPEPGHAGIVRRTARRHRVSTFTDSLALSEETTS